MMEIKNKMNHLIWKQVNNTPLILFRIVFGLLLCFSVLRFWYYGWIEEQYIKPTYFFTYLGFDWVKPVDDIYLYAVFFFTALSALFITLGLFYRISSIVFFLCFTYVELLDKTNYLNHYYFVSLISFLLIFLPAHRNVSLDIKLFKLKKRNTVANGTIWILKLQLCMVYFFAGLAKLNPDWLLNAQPLMIWLPAKSDLPIIGGLLEHTATAYVLSWAGALFDLSVPFLLAYKKTTKWAYIMVVVFHMLTWMLFPIGMFPFIMIGSTLIFFDFRFLAKEVKNVPETSSQGQWVKLFLMGGYFVIQLFLPLRFLLYPGNVFWSEEAYRFSWRVMLMEKAGYINFTIRDGTRPNIQIEANNKTYLTANQEKMMATQPDMILQFAHYLAVRAREEYHIEDPQVFATSYVTFNGRGSQPFINPKVDLTKIKRSWWNRKDWVLEQQH